jgi:hypothetical protein
MQTIEEFMTDFFRARSAQLEREREDRKAFRERFYSRDCSWDSRKGDVERSGRERVVSISRSEKGADVITEGTDPWPKVRYHLRSGGDGWVIEKVDGQCFACRGATGIIDCVCEGAGWIGESETAESIRSRKGVSQ